MKKSFLIYFTILLVSLGIGASWDKYPIIKNTAHGILDPTAGFLLEWNLLFGFLIIVAVISLILTITQKIFVNQGEMRAVKAEQKFLQAEMKKYSEHPEKLMELQKRNLHTMSATFHLMTRSLVVTAIPIILFFRWFQEALTHIWGGWWILYYLVTTIIFSSIFRKLMNVA